jgi:hypothetical protein
VPPRDPPPTVCMMCLFLADAIADPVERGELRRRLVLGSSGVQTLGADVIVARGDGIVDVLVGLTRKDVV